MKDSVGDLTWWQYGVIVGCMIIPSVIAIVLMELSDRHDKKKNVPEAEESEDPEASDS